MDDKTRTRRRSAWRGLLLVLLLVLGVGGYRLTSSPSASTGPGTDKPSAAPSAAVLAPQQSGSASGTASGTQVVLAPAASTGTGNGNCVDPASEAVICVHHFGVAVGQVQPLYPGLTRALPVTYSNDNNFDIFISTYGVSVSSGNPTACAASNLLVPSGTITLNPALKAAKNASVTTTVPIKLATSAPDGCRQVTFTITVNASAVKK
jgi:hypothetical protein